MRRRLKDHREQRREHAIRRLAQQGRGSSIPSEVFGYWSPDGQFVRDCHVATSSNDTLQVAFDNLAGVPGFGTLDGARLVRAQRPLLGFTLMVSRAQFKTFFATPLRKPLQLGSTAGVFVYLCRAVPRAAHARPTAHQSDTLTEADELHK